MVLEIVSLAFYDPRRETSTFHGGRQHHFTGSMTKYTIKLLTIIGILTEKTALIQLGTIKGLPWLW
jgi:hypothetical protein